MRPRPRPRRFTWVRYRSPVQTVVLVICDGWGVAPPSPGNAIALARKPVFDRWMRDYAHATLEASGEAVGLPAGMMGNSEEIGRASCRERV